MKQLLAITALLTSWGELIQPNLNRCRAQDLRLVTNTNFGRLRRAANFAQTERTELFQ
jgi:hypothetical protein